MSTHPVAVMRRQGRRRNAIIITVSLLVLLVLLLWGAWSALQAPPTHTPETVAADTAPDLTFTSPSKLVTCQITSQTVRCQAEKATYGPYREGCPNNANQVRVDATNILRECAATFADPMGPLAFGDNLTRGDFTCQSRAAAMRCFNTKTQHGFSISDTNFIDY